MTAFRQFLTVATILACSLTVPAAAADEVTDWNAQAARIIAQGVMGTPHANRLMAMVQTSVYRALSDLEPGGSATAAVAAANRTALLSLVPSQEDAIERAYQQALAPVQDDAARRAGIATGEKAVAQVFAERAADGVPMRESYRPHTSPGAYVPTQLPIVPRWSERKPWLLDSAAQFRPGPPPALTSETWARDYNEVRTLGGRDSPMRTEEQTAIAKFWEGTLPSVYYGVVYSVAKQPGRDLKRNSRLFAAVTQAMDDAIIAVFEAKYYYGFWRPVTAIRNGDDDGNDATERDPSWLPLINTPVHPEYPCAHCIVAATVGTVLQAEIGDGPMPVLSTVSDMEGNPTRSWTSIEDFIREVSLARIYDGVHYRNSTEVGVEMGRRIGRLAVAKHFATP